MYYSQIKQLVKITMVIVILAGFSTSAYGRQSLACIEDLQNCTPWTPATATVEIPGFDCDITFGYSWRACDDPNCPGEKVTQMYMTYMSIPGGDPDCLAFLQWIIPSWPNFTNIRWDRIQEAFKDGMRQVTRWNFIDFYNQIPAFPPELREALECEYENGACLFPDPCMGKTYAAYEGTCVSYCMSYTPPAFGGSGQVIIQPDLCLSGDGCCIVNRTHCYCKQTGEVTVQETTTPMQGDCDPQSMPEPSCPVGFYNFQSECLVECP